MSWLYQPLLPGGAQQQAGGGGGPTYTLTADAGSFTLSGQAAGLRASRLLTAANGSFALSGQAATLVRVYTLAAGSGSFVLSGQAAGLRGSRLLSVEQGGFALTGQAVGLRASRLLTAAVGSFTLTGQDVDLSVDTGGATYTLAANVGGFALSGQAAGLSASTVVTTQSIANANLVMHFTNDGATDESVGTGTLKVDVSALEPACARVRIDRIQWSVSGGGVNILWDATTPDLVWHLPASVSKTLDFKQIGGLQNPKSAGWTGDVLFRTSAATVTYTVTMWMRKKQD